MDVKSFHHDRVVRGASATGLSDHRLVRSKFGFFIQPIVRHRSVKKCLRLNVESLHAPTVGENLRAKITDNLAAASAEWSDDVESNWLCLPDAVFDTSKDVLHFQKGNIRTGLTIKTKIF
jgi:hypothetical protein